MGQQNQIGDFYPRPPRGGRPALCELDAALNKISIHALREEGDHRKTDVGLQDSNFYPRPPRGGRQPARQKNRHLTKISIHALREEGDLRLCLQGQTRAADFYPRPPRGGRRLRLGRLPNAERISIHALREEGDHDAVGASVVNNRFLSTPSARRATISTGTTPRTA